MTNTAWITCIAVQTVTFNRSCMIRQNIIDKLNISIGSIRTIDRTKNYKSCNATWSAVANR